MNEKEIKFHAKEIVRHVQILAGLEELKREGKIVDYELDADKATIKYTPVKPAEHIVINMNLKVEEE